MCHLKRNEKVICAAGLTPADLPVLWGQLAHQHAQVLRVPLPVLAAEVLQQTDGLVETVEDAHHPERETRVKGHTLEAHSKPAGGGGGGGGGSLLRLLPGQPEEEVVDEGGELVADQDPVLVDQVVGGDVGVGPAEGLLQGVPLEGRDHVVLWKRAQGSRSTRG